MGDRNSRQDFDRAGTGSFPSPKIANFKLCSQYIHNFHGFVSYLSRIELIYDLSPFLMELLVFLFAEL